MWNCVSKSSQLYFNKFDAFLKERCPDITTYYHTLNKEYMIITKNKNIYYLDYYIKDWNISIEYNGDLFHANPDIYKENDNPIPYSNLKSQEIWEKDKQRIKTIKEERNITSIIIWESNLPNNENLIKLINERKI